MESRRAAAEVAAEYKPDEHGDLVKVLNHDPKCLAQIWASPAIWSLGYPDQALQVALDQLTLARQLGHIWNLVWGLTGGSYTLQFRGEAKVVLEWCAEARAIAHDRAMHIVELILYPNRSGSAMIAMGEYEAGYARLSSGTKAWEATGGVHLIPHMKVMLAQACLGMGQTEQAEALVRDAIELIDRTGHRMYEVEAHRVLGEILLNDTRRDEGAASKAFLKALEVAKSQQAKSWELRAAIRMARLWRDQGKRQQAHDLLAPVYGWFTEGFDTLDLKEAKTLLNELAR